MIDALLGGYLLDTLVASFISVLSYNLPPDPLHNVRILYSIPCQFGENYSIINHLAKTSCLSLSYLILF